MNVLMFLEIPLDTWQAATQVGLIGLAHLACLIGLVVALFKKRRSTALRFSVVGLSLVLVQSLAAWLLYRMALPESIATGSKAFEIQNLAIAQASVHVFLGFAGAAIPLVLSLILLARGLMIEPHPDEPVWTARAGGPAAYLTVAGLAVGGGLLCVSVLSYLDWSRFLAAMTMWVH